MLRTHTSPMQIRAMEAHPPPLYVVIPGRVYRPDSDATHTPQFHQVEGLAVDEDITLGGSEGDAARVRAGGVRRAARGPAAPALLPVHRAERRGGRLLLSLRRTRASSRDGARCYLCKGEGWLEVLGAGEVDPNVYAYVPTTERNAPGYDPEQVQGFAWGMGVERIAMLKHGIPDLRLYFENDLRFLEQFGMMRVPLTWLREYCDPDLDVHGVEERLTMTGTKVEAIHHHGVAGHRGVRRRTGAQRASAIPTPTG